MGNDIGKIQDQNMLIIKSRLLEKQVKESTVPDPNIINAINFVKYAKGYTHLILSGGGLRSLSCLGAIEYLDCHGFMNSIKSISACSYSALVATLYCIGCPLSELKKHIYDRNWSRMYKTTGNVTATSSDIYHVASTFGKNDGSQLLSLITELIEKYTGNPHYTLNDLYHDRGIDLVISCLDLASKSLIFLNREQHPNVPLRVLLRATCTIPEIMAPIILDGHYLVDASIKDYCSTFIYDLNGINPNVLIIDLLPDLPVSNDILLSDITQQLEVVEIKNNNQYIESIINSSVMAQNNRFNIPENKYRAIYAHIPSYDYTKHNFSSSELKKMHSYVYSETSNFIEK